MATRNTTVPTDRAEREVWFNELAEALEFVAAWEVDSKSEDYVQLRNTADTLRWLHENGHGYR